jgi:hypothetical protein
MQIMKEEFNFFNSAKINQVEILEMKTSITQIQNLVEWNKVKIDYQGLKKK